MDENLRVSLETTLRNLPSDSQSQPRCCERFVKAFEQRIKDGKIPSGNRRRSSRTDPAGKIIETNSMVYYFAIR